MNGRHSLLLPVSQQLSLSSRIFQTFSTEKYKWGGGSAESLRFANFGQFVHSKKICGGKPHTAQLTKQNPLPPRISEFKHKPQKHGQ